MPGVVENEQARRISKSIDEDLKVCPPSTYPCLDLTFFHSAKGKRSGKDRSKKGMSRVCCLPRPGLLRYYVVVL